MKHGFIKVACITPKVQLGNPAANAEACFTAMREAQRGGARICVFPELSLTGYTCADLFLQPTLLRGAQEALATVLQATRALDTLAAIGLPLSVDNKLYNCAAIIHKGIILGVVPKTHLPNYGEFQELRWFTPAPAENREITLCAQRVTFGTKQLFRCESLPQLVIAAELCEDLWSACPPSIGHAAAGATVLLNLSASNEVVGKARYRRNLVCHQSAALTAAYLYAAAGDGESTTDLVFTGHNLIAENGAILSEYQVGSGMIFSELDLERLCYERARLNTFPPAQQAGYAVHSFTLEPCLTTLSRSYARTPFVPQDALARRERCEEIMMLSALGLKRRMEHTGAKKAVVGLSGGLDSTLAILIASITMKLMGRPSEDVLAITMPCFGTTERTRENAVELASLLHCELRRIDLSESVTRHLKDIGHDFTPDVTFENAQARERTQVLMDLANMEGGLVIGTGDLSEIALGWSTYNGDHMSMYAVNAGIPKTLVRHLVSYVSDDRGELQDVLSDILDTPVSPELLPAVQGNIAQKTEDIVGPYELHDFFLYHIIRWGCAPAKVLRLAEHAFAGTYDRATILHWLKRFYTRFFAQQFKRSCMPDGVKIGSVSLSPRGDWRMPSDAQSALWLSELERL